MDIQHIEVILKLASRCNINCSYCYYFYGADNHWKNRPKKLSPQTILQTLDFLKNAVLQYGIHSIQIDFHGGEPLLFGKSQFEALCHTFKHQLNAYCNLRFAIQTNATLIDTEWLLIFEKFNISTSISLDGPKLINDQYRIDHKGRGTYLKVVKGLQKLQAFEIQKRIPPVHNLAVINPMVSGSKVYRHFVDELNLRHMDFLLPGFDYDTIDYSTISKYGDFLIDVLNEWRQDNNPEIKVRFFEAFIAKLYGQYNFMFPKEGFLDKKNIALTIDTDGRIYGDDALRSNQAWNGYKTLNVQDHEFIDFYNIESQWHQENINLPTACRDCIWQQTCGGGQLENRYHYQKGYNNPSIYCESLQRVYYQLLKFLIDNNQDLTHIVPTNAT